MTSIELVEFINSQRKEGESELRHDNFMAKVPKVIGDAAPKFLGTAFYTKLPKVIGEGHGNFSDTLYPPAKWTEIPLLPLPKAPP